MKKVILTEEQSKNLASALKDVDKVVVVKPVVKQYVINPDKVLIVQKYLDGNFKRGKSECVGPDGFPCISPIFGMMSSNGEILQNLTKEKMHDLLVDKYKKMFTDPDERSKFLMQVLNDWYGHKIGIFGKLSVNHL